MSTIYIKQVRSRIGCPKNQKRTLDALGLRKINRVVEHEDSPTILGMVEKVKHLVSVTEKPILTKQSKNTDFLKIKTILSIDNSKELCKMAEKKFLGKYNPIEEIGEGGNAKVFRSTDINNEPNEVALKELFNVSPEKKARFIDEINIMVENCSLIDGIIPILDFSKEHFWYTMPLATSVIKHIKNENRNIVQIVA